MVRVHPGSFDDGLLVQGDDAGSARRKSGFNSPAVHCKAGSWSKRDDTSSAGWESGFESRWVHSVRKVAGYGWPGRTANACPREGMRVQIPCLPLLPRW